jgi:hypothetical protein
MDKKIIGLVFVFFLAFSLFISIVVFNQPLSRFTRAKEDSLPSTEKSLIFAWPLTNKINNQVTINVFVRNEKGIPLANKNVILRSTLGNVFPNSATTDKSGKVTFNLVSDNPGIAEVSAIVEGNFLNQKVSIKFE